MKTIEFKNSVYQEEFFALEEALNYLNKVMNIINSPVLLDNKLSSDNISKIRTSLDIPKLWRLVLVSTNTS